MTAVADPGRPPVPGGQPRPEAGVRELDRDECLRLLAENTFGRVGVSVGALPAVLPVNYRLVDGRIVFRTSPGTKLAAATSGAVVAFEIDDTDPVSHGGWSVLVVGVARVVADIAEVRRLRGAGVPRWTEGFDERFVGIESTQITGRRIGGWRPGPAAPVGPQGPTRR